MSYPSLTCSPANIEPHPKSRPEIPALWFAAYAGFAFFAVFRIRLLIAQNLGYIQKLAVFEYKKSGFLILK
jgi:hypothetical protein